MRIGLYRVTGLSMSPGLQPGDYVLIAPRINRQYRPGDVVVADHPRYGRIIKRVTVVAADGLLHLCGTHPASTPSLTLGSLPLKRIKGRVIWRFRPGKADQRPQRHAVGQRINRTGH